MRLLRHVSCCAHPWLAAGHYPLTVLEQLKLPKLRGGFGAVELKINFCKFASGTQPRPGVVSSKQNLCSVGPLPQSSPLHETVPKPQPRLAGLYEALHKEDFSLAHKPTLFWTNCYVLIKECIDGKFRSEANTTSLEPRDRAHLPPTTCQVQDSLR